MSTGNEDAADEFKLAVQDMTRGIEGVREALQLVTKGSKLDVKDGISLLSLKHHLLLSYLQSLTLLSAHRLLGRSLKMRSRPPEPFMAQQRSVRGAEPGDLVDILIEDRVILEKIKQLETKMRYQIEKLVRVATEEQERAEADIVNDPLAFRPNPANLVNDPQLESEEDDERDGGKGKDIYRPPKVAPMPYTEDKAKSKRRVPVPSGLATLANVDGHNPHVESTSGLGGTPSLASSRAKELASMTEFEEENMMRLVMKKKEVRRRERDEEAVALGGTGFSKGRRRGDGLQDEFNDILRAVDRGRGTGMDDGYEALRTKGRKQDVFSRARMRTRDTDDDGGRPKKKTRFQKAVKLMKKKQKS